MGTREKILEAALQLFNERGTGAVSTNHIAEAAGISPGNLYYHFRNKDEIIRALFEQVFAQWDAAFTLVAPPTLDDVTRLVRTNFEIMGAYRFIYRELMALLHQDEALRERYGVIRVRGYEGFREIVALLTEAKVMAKSLDDALVRHLADLCWMISEFWLPTVEISGQVVNAEQMERGVAMMLQVLKPYIRAD